MINWILGALIIGLAGFIILRTINRMRKGQGTCCSGCSQAGKGTSCHCGQKERQG